MPPIPIIAPQPRRLLPQPTIIDPSAPVLPINPNDPFIVSAFVWSLPALSEEAHGAFLRSAIRRHPRTLNFLASCLQSVFITAPSVLWFVFPRPTPRPSIIAFFNSFLFFFRPRSLRRRAAPLSDQWAALHVPPAVDGTISARKLSLRPV